MSTTMQVNLGRISRSHSGSHSRNHSRTHDRFGGDFLEHSLVAVRPRVGGGAKLKNVREANALERTTYLRFGKRAMDLLIGSLLLIIASPVMLAVAVLVRLTSDGPIIFAQDRLGKDAKLFRFYKFRTMICNQSSATTAQYLSSLQSHGELFKERSDPRLTRIGAFLRKTSLDELPQLWNVIRGDISLVGPRPLMPELFANHEQAKLDRSRIKPGITGYWQVFERGHCTHLVEMVELDLLYQANMSLWTDAIVLALTIPAVLSCRGAR